MVILIFGEILFYVLIVFIGIGILFLRWKGKLQFPTKYKILVVVLKKGCNPHKHIKPDSLPCTETIDNKEYKITKEDIWKIKTSFIKIPYHFLTGIKGNYICIFRGSTGESIKSMETKATPILIRNVKRSKILGKALNEMFKGKFGGTGRFLMIILIVAIALFYAYNQGWIG